MLARRFFHISLGILALSVAYHLGAQTVRADWQPGIQGQVVGVGLRADNTWMLITNSGAYSIVSEQGWGASAVLSFPAGVTPADVKFFEGSQGVYLLVSKWDEVWTSSAGGEPWQSHGVFPGGPTPTKSTSWGTVKGREGK